MRLLGAKMQEAMDKFLNDPCQKNEINLISALKKATFFAPVLLNQALAKPDGGVVYEEEGSNIKFTSFFSLGSLKNLSIASCILAPKSLVHNLADRVYEKDVRLLNSCSIA